jgi:hypothetical protein
VKPSAALTDVLSSTAEGSTFLENNRALVDAVFARMTEASRAYGSGPAPEILRAMHNLQLALSVRLGRGPLTEAQIDAVTAALDRAASEIERHGADALRHRWRTRLTLRALCGIPRQKTHKSGREPGILLRAQTGVQEVAQGVAEHVEGQYDDADGQAGKNRQIGGGL